VLKQLKKEAAAPIDESKLERIDVEVEVKKSKGSKPKKAATVGDSQPDEDTAASNDIFTLESLNSVYHLGPAQKKYKIGQIIGHLKLRPMDPQYILKVLRASLSTGVSDMRELPIPCVLHGGKYLFQIDRNHKLPVIAFLGLV